MDGCFIAGADPELMLMSPEGALVSGIPLIAGTKEKPQAVPRGAVQHDNVMVEFNVDPASSSESFQDNIRVVMGELARLVRPNRLVVQAYAKFPASELEHPEARVFGCDPDFCAWPTPDGHYEMNSIPSHRAMEPYRSAGGHFHIGHKPDIKEMLLDDFGRITVVQMLDILMGIPSVLLDPDKSAKKRRRLYGTAGAHRPKDYGVEYRALGNFWLRSPELVDLMYQLADLAIRFSLDGASGEIIEAVGQANVEAIINKSQKAKAKKVLMHILKRYLPREIFESIRTHTVPKEDLYHTWRLAA